MSNLLRYLLSFVVHLAWMRSGKKGPVPPMRLPFGKNKGRLTPLPVIASWQLVAVLWVAKKIWERYGDEIQQKLDRSKDALLQRVDRVVIGQAKTTSSAPAPPTTPAPQYHTQVLPSDITTPSTSSAPLPTGKVLSELQGTG